MGRNLQLLLLEDKTSTLKPEKEWYTTEDEASLANFKALNAIHNGVDKNLSRLINTYTSAKDVL